MLSFAVHVDISEGWLIAKSSGGSEEIPFKARHMYCLRIFVHINFESLCVIFLDNQQHYDGLQIPSNRVEIDVTPTAPSIQTFKRGLLVQPPCLVFFEVHFTGDAETRASHVLLRCCVL